MIRETAHLYECRDCGGLAGGEQLSCPYCGNSEGPTVERGSLSGGTETVVKSWYRRIKIVPEGVQR